MGAELLFSAPKKAGKIFNMTGMTFNDLTAKEFVGIKGKTAMWRFSCSCGNEDFITAGNLVRSGNTRSCGCRKHQPAVNRDTQEMFLQKAIAKHGEFIDYSLVKYEGGKVPVELVCPVHGNFFVKAFDHIKATHPCPLCAKEKRAKAQTFSKEDFVSRAKETHGEKYDYSFVEYKTARINVNIVCPEHGTFSQKPDSHLRGSGCPHCGMIATWDFLRSDAESFIAKARKIHGDLYDYSGVKYSTARIPVEIKCTVTGTIFYQTPDNHLRGMGCACCAKHGFDQGSQGVLYILQADDWLKIGITNYEPEKRIVAINRSSPRRFSELTHYAVDGVTCNRVETELLRWLRSNARPVQEKFEGSSETFYDIHPVTLINKVEEMLYG